MSAEARFVADGMLGSLARKLRIYGFDVVYEPRADDKWLLDTGLRGRRILLTSDRELHASALRRRLTSILVTAETDEDRVADILRNLGLEGYILNPAASRCPACNGVLQERTKKEFQGVLPDRILQRHREFYVCTLCGKAYWKGSHWRRIRAFTVKVQRILQKTDKAHKPSAPAR